MVIEAERKRRKAATNANGGLHAHHYDLFLSCLSARGLNEPAASPRPALLS